MIEPYIISPLIYPTPVGDLAILASSAGVVLCDWCSSPKYNKHLEAAVEIVKKHGLSDGIAKTTVSQLDDYFNGKRKQFTVSVYLSMTSFKTSVLNELMKLPYGTTLSYSGLAQRTGKPSAVRAVASAVADNPLSILIPCHRIVGDSAPMAYAGGKEAKRFLLKLESTDVVTTKQ